MLTRNVTVIDRLRRRRMCSAESPPGCGAWHRRQLRRHGLGARRAARPPPITQFRWLPIIMPAAGSVPSRESGTNAVGATTNNCNDYTVFPGERLDREGTPGRIKTQHPITAIAESTTISPFADVRRPHRARTWEFSTARRARSATAFVRIP